MLTGNGFFIWQVPSCEGGDPVKIAQAAKDAGLSWVAVKIANGTAASNRDPRTLTDLLPPVVTALKAAGITVLGWHYVYGFQPMEEADVAIQRLKTLNLDGYIIDAEAEYKYPGRDKAADVFTSQLRTAFPGLFMALCSYRFPDYHPELPWLNFLAKVDANMPQVYWEQAHNAAQQLTQSIVEFNALTIKRPIFPIGPTYKVQAWAPTVTDIQDFRHAAANLRCPAVGYFSWDECRRDLPDLWGAATGNANTVYLPFVSNATPAPAPVTQTVSNTGKTQPVSTVSNGHRYLIQIGPRWVYANAELTGKATGRVNRGTVVTIVAVQGRSGLLQQGGWIDISSGVLKTG